MQIPLIQLMMLGALQRLIEQLQIIRDLINMGKYDADLAKYIHGLLDLEIQVMLDDIETREKVASYKDKEQLDFQILLTDNYYINPSNIHICFPIKIKKKQKQIILQISIMI